jgi:hypothetical protein
MGDATASGGCHCGAIRYIMPTEVVHHALCHCIDCRRHAGAPGVAWALVSQDELKVEGTPVEYASSQQGRRQFCGTCGTGLFYLNATIFPGMVDVQSATLDDPDAVPLVLQIQLADRIGWMGKLDDLPAFERYPPME